MSPLQNINDLAFDIPSLHAAYGQGLKPETVIDEVFRRITALADPGIFLYLSRVDTVKTRAAELGSFDPARKPLWGIPFAIKDNIDAAGLPTTAACPDFAYTAEANAFVVDLLLQAGAILIGKTNLDQFATGLVGVRSPYPAPKNALDPEIVPGGSSSGSAVAVAQGLVSFSLGTDTAGSGRVPAALNGIVGLKPSLGALSNRGVVPACRSLDSVSIFALSVDDAYAVFRQTAVFDEADAFAHPCPTPPLATPPPSFKVGVPDMASREFFGDKFQAIAFSAQLEQLKAQGAEIIEMDFTPFYAVADLLYHGAWVAERYAAIEPFIKSHADSLHPVTRQIIGGAETLSAVDTFRGHYRLEELKRQTTPLIDSVDLFCVPTIPTFYSVADLEADPITPNTRLGTYTNFVNLLDLCGIAVPANPRSDGRPGSVTLLARAGRDAQVAALASSLQLDTNVSPGATGWPLPAGPQTDAAVMPDEIGVAVVGAHMSGLPLNRELTRLGGRFLRATRTAAQYRLYSLPGGPPYRPGLMADDSGASIDLEVWALPQSRFGEFMRGIPSPLGIGTVMLIDGTSVNGFICEQRGLSGAKDITNHGGWRAFLQTQTAQPSTTSSTTPSK